MLFLYLLLIFFPLSLFTLNPTYWNPYHTVLVEPISEPYPFPFFHLSYLLNFPPWILSLYWPILSSKPQIYTNWNVCSHYIPHSSTLGINLRERRFRDSQCQYLPVQISGLSNQASAALTINCTTDVPALGQLSFIYYQHPKRTIT